MAAAEGRERGDYTGGVQSKEMGESIWSGSLIHGKEAPLAGQMGKGEKSSFRVCHAAALDCQCIRNHG